VLFLPRSKHKQTKRPLKRERKTLITSAFGLVNVRSVILSKKKKFLVLSCLDAAQCEKGGCLNVSRKKICKISSKKFEHACLSSEEPQVRKKKKKCCLSSEKPSVKKIFKTFASHIKQLTTHSHVMSSIAITICFFPTHIFYFIGC
jgi:hypothetical protein